MHRTRLARIVAGALAAALVLVGLVASPASASVLRTVTGHVWVGDTSRSAVLGEVQVTAVRVGASVSTTTDADGNFSLQIPLLGSATAFQFEFSYLGDGPYFDALWPGLPISDTSASARVELAGGDRAGLDLVMPGLAHVTGHVKTSPDADLAAGDVSIYYQRQGDRTSALGPESGPILIDQNGDWEADLPPGRYVFRFDALSDRYVDIPYLINNTLSMTRVYGEQRWRDITLLRTRSVGGPITLGKMHPRPAGEGEVIVTWVRAESKNGPWPTDPDGSTSTDVTGSFMIEDLPVGWYRFGFDYVGTDAERYVDIPFATDGAWEVTASTALRWTPVISRLYSLSGKVMTGTRAAAAGEVEVVYYDLGYYPTRTYSTVVDAEGRWTFPNVREDFSATLYFNYLGRSGYIDKHTSFWNLDRELVVDTTLERGTSLWGTVRDTGNAPIGGVDVTLTTLWISGDNAGEVFTVTHERTDDAGFYAFNGIDTDSSVRFYVTYERDGYAFMSYPSNNEFTVPGLVKLAEREIKANTNMRLFRSSSISGNITSTAIDLAEFGEDNLGVQLLVRSGSSYVPSGYWETVESDGSYELTDLAPGSYRAQVAYVGDRGEANVRSAIISLAEGSIESFDAQLRPFDRDFTDDGPVDLIARTSSRLETFAGTGSGKALPAQTLSTEWAATTTTAVGGDLDGDGLVDLIGRAPTGEVTIYRGDGEGGLLGEITVGTWPSINKILAPGDVDGDGDVDLMTRDSTGRMWLRLSDGAGAFADPVQIATGWKTHTIATASDFNRDSFPDLFVKTSGGTLYLYPGNGTGGFKARVKLASEWTKYNAIVGVGDFSGDWNPDIIARDKSGVLWLMKGNNAGTLSTRVKISSGWKSRTLIG